MSFFCNRKVKNAFFCYRGRYAYMLVGGCFAYFNTKKLSKIWWCLRNHEVCFNYYRLIVRFSPSCSVIEYCTTMASADFSRQALLRFFRKKLFEASVRPPRIRALSFNLIPTSFTPTVPNSYRTLICCAILSTVTCLIQSFCPLGQIFVASFLQIPPRDGHPCLWLCNSRY